MGRRWVVDASPLILLGKIGRIDLLPRLCPELVVPGAVVEELDRGPSADAARRWVHEAGSRFVQAVADLSPQVVAWDLGLGETEVLSLCHGQADREAVLDDRLARNCAAALGVAVRGTFAVVVLAKKAGLIQAVRPFIAQLVEEGIRVDPSVIARALSLAGED